jgi:hypothetical protein
MKVATSDTRIAPATSRTEHADDAFPMPEGYMQRLDKKQLTKNDEAWQAVASLREPSVHELKLLSSATTHEAMAHAARKRAERLAAERGVTAPINKDMGALTLHSLPHGSVEPPLVPPFLTPNGATILFGPGGVGKGMLSVYFTRELQRAGINPMVIDYESHRDEWGRRARNMGYTEDELQSIPYREPFGDEWKAGRGTLIQVAAMLREECDALGTEYLILDSYAASTSSGDALGGQAAADEFFAGLRIIGRPALVIAHVTGNAQRFPDKPFGTVFVHNYARETWAVEAASDTISEVSFDHDTNPLQPSVLALELRQKKRNVGRPAPPQFINFSFFHDEHIEVDRVQPAGRMSIADMFVSVMERSDKPLTVKELRAKIKADFDYDADRDTAEKTLNRNETRFARGDTAPYSWSRRVSS